MEINAEGPISQPDPPGEPELDFYTIPTYSRWFLWERIHETERISLSEFFDGTSITRSPKIYKEYRDFIISKYREEPSRRLTFTEVRKSLVGDVTLLHKIFMFLEKWGLINFSAASNDDSPFATLDSGRCEDSENIKVRAEEGPPHGVRVVVNPNSLKPVSVLPCWGDIGDFNFKSSPLASHSDVFGDLTNPKGLPCSSCGDSLCSGRYEFLKGSYTICAACFKNEKYGENKCADDFKFVDFGENNGPIWTEAENLLLLESVLKHGNDWELVAQNVKTKTKLECISRLLIEMPFGDLMLDSLNEKNAANDNRSCSKEVRLESSHETLLIQNEEREKINDGNENEEGDHKSPPLKRKSISDVDHASLLKQVARISGKFAPCLAAAAAKGAMDSFCEENPFAEGLLKNGSGETPESEMPFPPQSGCASNDRAVPLSLRIRMEMATAVGAAGGHAALLAEEESREMEDLVRTLIQAQAKKMQLKVKRMEELEKMKEGEYGRMKEVEDLLIGEWIQVVRKEHDL